MCFQCDSLHSQGLRYMEMWMALKKVCPSRSSSWTCSLCLLFYICLSIRKKKGSECQGPRIPRNQKNRLGTRPKPVSLPLRSHQLQGFVLIPHLTTLLSLCTNFPGFRTQLQSPIQTPEPLCSDSEHVRRSLLIHRRIGCPAQGLHLTLRSCGITEGGVCLTLPTPLHGIDNMRLSASFCHSPVWIIELSPFLCPSLFRDVLSTFITSHL